MLKRGVSSFSSCSGNRVTGKKGKGIRRILILGELLVRRQNPGEWARRETSCVFIGLETLGDTSGLISYCFPFSSVLQKPVVFVYSAGWVSFPDCFMSLLLGHKMLNICGILMILHFYWFENELRAKALIPPSFTKCCLRCQCGFFATQVIIKQWVSLTLKSKWLCMIYSFMFLKSASVFLFTDLWKSSGTHWCLFQILF